jgi:site-specific recombinase XerD
MKYKQISKHITKNSLGTMQTAILTFYKWAYENEKVESNITRNISKIKPDKKLPVYLTLREIKDLLSTATNPKDNLMVKILFSTGARVSEFVNMKKQDINFDTGEVRIFGKGSKERIVLIGSDVIEELKVYCANLSPEQRLYPVSTETIERHIKVLARTAGITKHITPHKLRHSFATHLNLSGTNIVTIQELLGHSNLTTTQIYTHAGMEIAHKAYANSPLEHLNSL